MKTYPKYRDSGIEWLGEIPSQWDVKRLKDIGNICLGKMLNNKPSDGYHLKPYLKSKNIGWLQLNLSDVEEMYFNDQEMRSLRLNKGDLILSEGGEVGKTSLWNEELDECYIQNSAHKISFNNNCDSRYYLYLSYLLGHIGYYKSIVNLVSIMHLTFEKLRRILVCVPPLVEQQRIADYLDEKCGEIDGQVALLEKKRDAYARLKVSVINKAVTHGLNPDVSMRPSGIDWIGDIPAHWQVRRFKEMFSAYTTGITPDSKNDKYFEVADGYTWVTIADMTSKFVSSSNLNLSQTAVDLFQPQLTKKGSLLFSFKLSIGKICFAQDDLYTNEAIVSIPPQDGFDLNFMYYLLPKILFLNATENIYGAKMLNQKIIANMKIMFPPIEEQRAIADYLDKKCGEIDAVVENLDKQIDAYKRLKKSLINEVVTGKRAV